MNPIRLPAGIFILLLSGCGPGMRDIRRGEQLYAAGTYRESYDAFHRALAASGDPALQYSVGKALYRLHRYEEAARGFRDATSVLPAEAAEATTTWGTRT